MIAWGARRGRSKSTNAGRNMVQWVMNKVKVLAFRARIKLGMQRTLPTLDRKVLEDEVFPHLLESGCRRVLFVGCDWYTRCYNDVFQNLEYWTLELDPEKERFGSDRHIVDTVENVADHFEEGYFDAIVCNGVFGWGLNERHAVEKAFGGCLRCLRPGGLFVLGWNDVVEHRPFPLDDCHSLSQFDRYELPSLATTDYRTPTKNRHTFSFYQKPGGVFAAAREPEMADADCARSAGMNLMSLLSPFLVAMESHPFVLL